MSPKETAYIVERLAVRFMAMVAEYERKLLEHRDAFGVRTSADAKIIEGLRDLLRREYDKAALKSQTPQHPVKVGEWVKRLTPSPMTPAGGVAKVTDVFEVHGLAVKIERPDGLKGTWWAKCCEPCDPPVDHDTSAGKEAAEASVMAEIKVGDVVRAKFWKPSMTAKVTEILPDGRLMLEASSEPWKVDEVVKMISKVPQEAAEAVIRDSQMTEIKVGDVVEVVSASSCVTFGTDIGRRGKVTHIGEKTLDLAQVPDYALPVGGVVAKRDVRKVPQ